MSKDKQTKHEVRIEFHNKTKKQREHLFEAERELHRAGVKFDTGYGDKKRDWEFDWSLKGAKVVQKSIKVSKKGIKKIGKFNLLEENICDLKCDCGWNLWISGEDIKDLKKIKDYLKKSKKTI